MADTLTKGTLVRINDHREGNAPMVDNVLARHGRLWLIDSTLHATINAGWYWCKSIATGADFDFHTNEMEVADGH